MFEGVYDSNADQNLGRFAGAKIRMIFNLDAQTGFKLH